MALVLAAIGIFGVLSYAVAQRTREIGIRMALGAQERTVVSLVVRQAMILVAVGVVARHGRRAVPVADDDPKMLFSVSPTDPATFAGVAAFSSPPSRSLRQLPAGAARDPGRPDRRAAGRSKARSGLPGSGFRIVLRSFRLQAEVSRI